MDPFRRDIKAGRLHGAKSSYHRNFERKIEDRSSLETGLTQDRILIHHGLKNNLGPQIPWCECNLATQYSLIKHCQQPSKMVWFHVWVRAQGKIIRIYGIPKNTKKEKERQTMQIDSANPQDAVCQDKSNGNS